VLDKVKDIDLAYESLARALDPELTYSENLRLVEEELKTKLSPEIESEVERYYHEKRAWVREQAEALSIAREIEERVRKELEEKVRKVEEVKAPSMSKEEAFEYLSKLVTSEKAEKHRDQFEEEWGALEGLPREEQERALRLLAKEIELKEEREKILPPKRPSIPRKVYEEARKAPGFYELLERYFDEEIERRRG
jgi:DNA-dependent RNA polymerase auxiliary subunit epsilon